MALELTPIVLNCKPSITCLETWYTALLVGTKDEGVLVYETVNTGNAFGVIPQDVVLPSTSITQLSTADIWNILLVLYGGKLDVFKFGNNERISVTFSCAFKHEDVEKFATCTQGGILRLCVAVHDRLFIYYYNGSSFYTIHKFAYTYAIDGLVLASTRLYITYSLESHSYCNCIDFSSMSRATHSTFKARSPIKCIAKCENGLALVQQGCTGILLERDVPKQELKWSNPPRAVVNRGDYFLGITNEGFVAVSNFNTQSSYEVPLKDDGPLLYITGKSTSFVASSSKIWRLVLPAQMSPPGDSFLKPVGNFRKKVESGPISEHSSHSFPNKPVESFRKHVDSGPILSHSFPSEPVETFSEFVESGPIPANFSPSDPLSVVGLNTKDQEKFQKEGFTTVQQFAQMTPMTVKHIFKQYWIPYRIAVDFMDQYDTLSRPETVTTSSIAVINPEDPLEAIGMNKSQIEFLASMTIFTVRQFALIKDLLGNDFEVFQATAAKVLELTDKKNKWMESSHVYGYVYLSTREFSNVLDSRELKSKYSLFLEYMECDSSRKADHPWKVVYYQFCERVKRERGFVDAFYEPSDADIFAYISSLFVTTIGKVDCTATTRAIFFHEKGNHDKGLQSGMHIIKINLTGLCKDGGKLYRRTSVQEWTPVSLLEYSMHQQQTKILHYGCIVMPSGTIGWENIVTYI